MKSSGYTAEYGGATGGVINAITKSGTNNWSGSVLFNYEGDALSGGAVPAAGFTGFVTNTGVPTNRLDPRQPERIGVRHLSEGRREPHRTGLLARWTDRRRTGCGSLALTSRP